MLQNGHCQDVQSRYLINSYRKKSGITPALQGILLRSEVMIILRVSRLSFWLSALRGTFNFQQTAFIKDVNINKVIGLILGVFQLH